MEDVRVEYIDLASLIRWPRSAKEHDLEAIYESIEHLGYESPVVIDELSGKIVAGHSHLDDLLQLKVSGVIKPPESIDEKNGSWEVPVIRGIQLSWGDKTSQSLLPLFLDLPHIEPLPGEEEEDGSLLHKIEVFLDEPVTQTQKGDVYNVAPCHVLVVADVITGVDIWKKYLVDGMCFAPYPGPFAAVTVATLQSPYLFVQPDPYIAGHFLDVVKAINDGGVVKR